MTKLNGTAKYVIPSAAILALVGGLHVLQQRELGEVRTCATDNTTEIARVDERTGAQFDEILRSLARIEKELKE